MLSPHNLTSIYHNAWGEIKDDTFFPDNEHLPSIKTSSLYKNQNNLLTRKAEQSDFIANLIWPVFNRDLVAFSCNKATEILVDNKQMLCNLALQFIKHPLNIQINK